MKSPFQELPVCKWFKIKVKKISCDDVNSKFCNLAEVKFETHITELIVEEDTLEDDNSFARLIDL
jgi:hypothetical protein